MTRSATECLYCSARPVSRGLCATHWQRWRKRLPMEAPFRWSTRRRGDAARRAFDAEMRREFGISADQYDALFVAQGGVCAVCKQPERWLGKKGKPKRLSVDHDHACCPTRRARQGPPCGQCVRGLLCYACNVSLGQLNDDAARIRALADYVETHSRYREAA